MKPILLIIAIVATAALVAAENPPAPEQAIDAPEPESVSPLVEESVVVPGRDYGAELDALAKRVKALEDRPNTCAIPMPIAKVEPPKSTDPIDVAEDAARKSGEPLLITFHRTNCPRCRAFQPILDRTGRPHLEVNLDDHPDAASRFKLSGLLPRAVLWNPKTESFHEIPTDSEDSFIGALDGDPPKRPGLLRGLRQ